MNNRGFGGFIGLLLTLAIISFLAYLISVHYLGKPQGMDQNTQQIVNQAGIDTTSQSSILDSTKSTIRTVEEMQHNQSDQLTNALSQ